MTIAAIIQARSGSTRLPGNVLRDLCGRPMLARVIQRVRSAQGVDVVCVATTTLARDDAVAAVAATEGASVFRGSEADVLGRYVGAADELDADVVVRITADCPLIDPTVIAEMLTARSQSGLVDCYTNTLERTYPRGLDTEIVLTETLDWIAKTADDRRAREHVTWHLYQHPDEFRIVNHRQARDLSHLRWTVDVEADFTLVDRIYQALDGDASFVSSDVLAVLDDHPEWGRLNAAIVQQAV